VANIEGLQESLRERGAKFFIGAYVDGLGVPKSKIVPLNALSSAIAGSERYTVGALEATGELGPNEDECIGLPDIERIVLLPWDTRYALAPTDLSFRGTPYSHCSRSVLKRQVEAARTLGYGCDMGVEPEVYVLRKCERRGWVPFVEEDTWNRPTRGYDLDTTLLADKFLVPMVEYIDALGWGTYSFDHEGGQGQYEFDFGYTDVLTMADRMVVFRLMAKHVARSLGCIASFMPKPWSEAFGSGAHLNVSLSRNGENAFIGNSGGNSYSAVAYHFTAGVLRHLHAITLLGCPTVNSYKRLNPRGKMNEMSWAPVYAAYGHNNRTLAARLPTNRLCLEVRHVDSATNFYLSAAMVLAAGLAGVRERLEPGEACEINTYEFSETDLAARGVHRLPKTLGEAIEAFAQDRFAAEVMGEAFHASYVAYKRREWEDYCLTVDEWEKQRYMHVW
jgi:glutamine synthetase